MGKSVFDQVLKGIKVASKLYDDLEKEKLIPKNKYTKDIKKAKKELGKSLSSTRSVKKRRTSKSED